MSRLTKMILLYLALCSAAYIAQSIEPLQSTLAPILSTVQLQAVTFLLLVPLVFSLAADFRESIANEITALTLAVQKSTLQGFREIAGEVGKFPDRFGEFVELQMPQGFEPTEVEQPVIKLLDSPNPGDWDRAAEILREGEIEQAHYYPNYLLRLAFNYESAGKFDRAIKLAEKALPLAAGDRWMFKNGLACFYADTGRSEYAEIALRYAAEARSEKPDDEDVMDTEGYVKITYGKTREEVLRGLELCSEARNQGVPDSTYTQRVDRAGLRLKELRE